MTIWQFGRLSPAARVVHFLRQSLGSRGEAMGADQKQTVPNGISNVQEMRQRARHHVESGAVTEEFTANRSEVIKLLNEALATELVCILRYKSHYYRASGINSEAVKQEFLQHAQEAQQHADAIAARIVQLNGAPDFNPDGLTSRSRSEYKPASTLVEMIKEDLIAERIAVEFYTEIIRWIGDADLTTRKVMQEILAVEAQHAEDMKSLLGRLAQADNARS
jgi:bacterioferritin